MQNKRLIITIFLTLFLFGLVYVFAVFTSVTQNFPVNYYNQSSSNAILNCTATISDSDWITNLSLYIAEGDNNPIFNQSNASQVNSAETYEFTVSNLADGRYNWSCFAEDNTTNTEFSTNRTITLDTTGPTVILNTPQNNTWSNTNNVEFNFTAYDSLLDLDSCDLYSDFGGSYSLNSTILNVNNNTLTNFTLIIPDNSTGYSWNVQCNDSVGNTAFNDTNFTIKVDATNPIIVLNAPSNNTWSTSSNVTFNYTVTDTNIDTCELHGDFNGTFTLNLTATSLTSEAESIDFSVILADSNTYSWNSWCNDSAGNNAWNSSNYTIKVDTTVPSLTVTPPSDTSITTAHSIIYTCSGSDSGSGISTYQWTLTKPDGSTDTSITTASATFTEISQTGQAGTYKVKCTVTDVVGHATDSSIYEFTASSDAGSSSGGGGGATTTVSYDVDLSTSDSGSVSGTVGRIKTFSFDGATKHTVTFKEITTNSAKIAIASTPIEVILNIGEAKKVDINSDGISDLEVTLDKIKFGATAEITIKKLAEGAKKVVEEEKAAEATEGPTTPMEPVSAGTSWVWITVIIVVVLVIIGYFVFKKK